MAESLKDLVLGIVKARFPDAEIDSISVTPDSDSDGDPILRVMIVVRSDITSLDSQRLSGLARHIRPRLIEHNEYGFPIIRVMTKRDRENLPNEAA